MLVNSSSKVCTRVEMSGYWRPFMNKRGGRGRAGRQTDGHTHRDIDTAIAR